MLGPSLSEDSLSVLKLEEVAEEKLVSKDGLARDDEGERELDCVVEGESLPGCERSRVSGSRGEPRLSLTM